MPEKNKNKASRKPAKKNKSSHITNVTFWVCLLLVLAPFVVLGWNVVSTSMDTGTPIMGDRYKDDLDPAITKKQMDSVTDTVKAVEGVDDAFVSMTSATLRVYVDIPDTADEATANATADSVYAAVSSVLDPATYFTRTDSEKMYDLEIHVYTLPERTDAEGENFVYVIDTKTSNMAEPAKQTVSVAKDQAVADQLRQDVIDRKAAEEAQKNAEAQQDTGEGGEVQIGEDINDSGEEAPAQ